MDLCFNYIDIGLSKKSEWPPAEDAVWTVSAKILRPWG